MSSTLSRAPLSVVSLSLLGAFALAGGCGEDSGASSVGPRAGASGAAGASAAGGKSGAGPGGAAGNAGANGSGADGGTSGGSAGAGNVGGTAGTGGATSDGGGTAGAAGTNGGSGTVGTAGTAGTNGGSGAAGTNGASGAAGTNGAGGGGNGFARVERLNRGVVAVQATGGIYVGWRMFGYEYDRQNPSAISYNLYRGATLVGNVTNSTNYRDTGGNAQSEYTVRAVVGGVEQAASETARVWPQNYLSFSTEAPAGGTSPACGDDPGGAYSYTTSDASVGDVDGDGQYEIVVKWEPSNAKDNSQQGCTGNVYLDAYRLAGMRLWRINLGQNIRAGAHYTQFLVYDFDGDGKAEVLTKTAPGTVDGAGNNVLLGADSATASYRNAQGYILTGSEYLTLFNGLTGANVATVPFEVARGTVSSWGDNYGNRVDRFLFAVAYVDNTGLPSAILGRGYYARSTITAWNWRNGQLTRAWTADSSAGTAYAGQGAHGISIANVDGDPQQEIIYGASTIESNGTRKCSTGFGHGDALHASDFLPSRPGIEVFQIHEAGNQPGASLRDGATCEVLFTSSNNGGVEGPGRGVAADIDPDSPGAEAWINGSSLWAASSRGTATTGLTVVGNAPSSCNFAIWWDADLSRELLNGNSVGDYDGQGGGFTASGCSANNGTKSTPSLSADVIGDWREEVIWRCGTTIRVYTTTALSTDRLYTLMHDPQYRVAIAWQNSAYNQPPHPSFHLGGGMALPPSPDIHVR